MSSPTTTAVDDDNECCWICLGESGLLERLCGCPHVVHKDCLMRWMVQSAGSRWVAHRLAGMPQRSVVDRKRRGGV